MRENAIISIIVPIYNSEKFLQKCVRSILNQSYCNLQIILVDDGSIDESPDICEKLAKSDERIYFERLKENVGQNKARMHGMNIANGQYIGFVDSDDWIEKNMYENLVNLIINSKADIACCGIVYDYADANGSCAVTSNLEIVKDNPCYDKDILDCLIGFNPNTEHNPSLCTKLYRGEIIKKALSSLPTYINRGEDRLANLICAFESKRIVSTDQALYHYYKKKDSSSYKVNEEDVYEISGFFGEAYRILKRYDAGRFAYDSLRRGFVNWMLPSIKEGFDLDISISRYKIADLSKYEGKKVVLYGAGNVGTSYYDQIILNNKIQLLACVDRNPDYVKCKKMEVLPIDVIEHICFDYIIVAVAQDRLFRSIKDNLISTFKIDENKIIWEKPNLDI